MSTVSEAFNKPTPAYLLVKPDELPNADAVLSLRDLLASHQDGSKLHSVVITAIKQNIEQSDIGINQARAAQKARFASLIKTVQALGESDSAFLAERILNVDLERVIEFMCLPNENPRPDRIYFDDQRLDFYRALALVPFTDEQAAAIITQSLFSKGRWVYEPELMCAAHWLDKMSDDDRREILQIVPQVSFGYKDASAYLDGTGGFNMTIGEHLVASAVMSTEDVEPPEWTKELLLQTISGLQP